MTKPIDQAALTRLKHANRYLTPQQFKTLRGQILAGNPDGAMRGLQRIIDGRRGSRDR